MRCNQNTVIVDPRVVLVPYRHEHVAKYHEWMMSPELRELTASEPLTLEQEYDMQRKWQEDEDKLTFIVLANDGGAPNPGAEAAWLRALPMVGDVNLFLKGSPVDEDFEAEVEIMIAEQEHRRRGLAHTVLQLFLSYASSALPAPIPRTRFVARIGVHNAPSIVLFAKLGFVETKRVEVFEEVEMRWREGRAAEWKAGERRDVYFGV